MLVEKIVVGELKENCYLLIIKDKCIIVDPGAEAAKIEKTGRDEIRFQLRRMSGNACCQ